MFEPYVGFNVAYNVARISKRRRSSDKYVFEEDGVRCYMHEDIDGMKKEEIMCIEKDG
jgi:hypothetical protein